MKQVVRFGYALLAAGLVLLSASCKKTPQETVPEGEDTAYYANLFAYNIMQTYYLWKAEVQTQMNDWRYDADPIKKVASLRYREGDKEVDRWTKLTDNFSSFMGSVTGNTTTYGLEIQPYRSDTDASLVYAVVTYTYADSPARKAGLERGDVIVSLDGTVLTQANYSSVLTEKLYSPTSMTVKLLDGRQVSMTAVQMYENPIHTASVVEYRGRKFGYLHFTSFTLDCCPELVACFQQFKEQGVKELVLDLRYNGGGYVSTSQVLASLMAPPQVVQEKRIFNRDVYNAVLSKEMDGVTPFVDTLMVSNGSGMTQLRTLDVNPALDRLWIIQTRKSASASEALVCGLKPYCNMTLVGETSYGKFCGGYLIGSDYWFRAVGDQEGLAFDWEDGLRKTQNWGIYVMASRYADCNGVTLSMPSGIPADYPSADDPLDGRELGDPKETMLATVLALSAGESPSKGGAASAGDSAAASEGASTLRLEPLEPVQPASFGLRLHSPAR